LIILRLPWAKSLIAACDISLIGLDLSYEENLQTNPYHPFFGIHLKKVGKMQDTRLK